MSVKRLMRVFQRLIVISSLLMLSLTLSPLTAANEQGFDAGDEEKVKAFIKSKQDAGQKPKADSPNWKAGYTCNDLKKHSFGEYQECRYYYSVNGRFYPN